MHCCILNNSSPDYITYIVQTVLKAFTDYSKVFQGHFRPLGETIEGKASQEFHITSAWSHFRPNRNSFNTLCAQEKEKYFILLLKFSKCKFRFNLEQLCTNFKQRFFPLTAHIYTVFLMQETTQFKKKRFGKDYLKMLSASHAAQCCC